MRWLFLFLFVLNGCYLVWNLQDAPVRAKDITSAANRPTGSQGIELLSEAGGRSDGAPKPSCDFVGGFPERARLEPVAERLRDAGMPIQAYAIAGDTGVTEHWLRLPPAPAGSNALPEELARDINGLKRKIIPCEGIATPE